LRTIRRCRFKSTANHQFIHLPTFINLSIYIMNCINNQQRLSTFGKWEILLFIKFIDHLFHFYHVNLNG
ncbi:hypothetical protein T02_408, partial [Trichinella nativa]